jgi:hypothetical protein
MTYKDLYLSGALPEDIQLSTARIIKGDIEQSFPYVCALTQSRDMSQIFCTATLIAPKVVITAAHCVASAALKGSSFNVLFVKEGSQTDFELFEVERVYVPKCYMDNKRSASGVKESSYLREFDLAIIILKSNVPSSLTEPCVLDLNPLTQSTSVKIVGFGLDKTESDILESLSKSDKRFDTLSESEQSFIVGQRLQSEKKILKRSAGISCETKGDVQICVPNSKEQIQYRGDSGGPILRLLGNSAYLCGINGYVSVESSNKDARLFTITKCVAASILSSMFFINECFKLEGLFGQEAYKVLEIPKESIAFDKISMDAARLYNKNATRASIMPELVISRDVVVSNNEKSKEGDNASASTKGDEEASDAGSSKKYLYIGIACASILMA